MFYPYVILAGRGREGRKELCASAGEALVCAAELREHGWSSIAFVDDQGDEVPSSAVRQKAVDDQARTAQHVATATIKPAEEALAHNSGNKRSAPA